jgi:two-component system response regulator NreC
MAEEIRVLLADDHPILRSGLAALLALEEGLRVVGQAATGEEAVERTRLLRPDVVVMDLGMPGIGGLEATRQVIALGLGARVLVLTSLSEEEYLLPVMDAGASGFVRKNSADVALAGAVRTVARGDVFLPPSAARVLLETWRHTNEPPAGPLDQLSERERRVLALTAEGYSSADIGKKLYLSPKTVDTYRARLMHRLGLAHRADLVRLALSAGLLEGHATPPLGA